MKKRWLKATGEIYDDTKKSSKQTVVSQLFPEARRIFREEIFRSQTQARDILLVYYIIYNIEERGSGGVLGKRLPGHPAAAEQTQRESESGSWKKPLTPISFEKDSISRHHATKKSDADTHTYTKKRETEKWGDVISISEFDFMRCWCDQSHISLSAVP